MMDPSRHEKRVSNPNKAGWRQRLSVLWQIKDSPQRVARGVAVGILVGLTPTVGIQMAIAAMIAPLFKANILAGMTLVWISNPLTMVPLYYVMYRVGVFVLGNINKMTFQEFENYFIPVQEADGLIASLKAFVVMIGEMSLTYAGPMFLGGFVMGLFFAPLGYMVTLNLLKRKEQEKVLS